MSRVLVLGTDGMLARAVREFLDAEGTQRRDPADALYLDAEDERIPLEPLFENRSLIVNAIGILQPLIDEDDPESVVRAETVNARFPARLAAAARATGGRVLHLSTDAVFSGDGVRRENSPTAPEGVYARTKLRGEIDGPGALTIRCSIVGPDPIRGRGLFEWFQARAERELLHGYANHLWNGVTTHQFAELCRALSEPAAFDAVQSCAAIRHFCPNETVSKHRLLSMFADALGVDAALKSVDAPAARLIELATLYDDLLEIYNGPAGLEDALHAMIARDPGVRTRV